MEGEKTEVKLAGVQIPSTAQQCVSIAIRGPWVWPQLHGLHGLSPGWLIGRLGSIRLSSLQLYPETKGLLVANPALLFSREVSDWPVAYTSLCLVI